MDHDESSRGHLHGVASHCDHACRRCCDACDFYSHLVRIITNHRVNLGSGEHIPAWTIQPKCNATLLGIQFIAERLRRDLISPEALRVDRTFKPEDSAAAVIVNPVPELFHLHTPILVLLPAFLPQESVIGFLVRIFIRLILFLGIRLFLRLIQSIRRTCIL